jgi:hypothetical protein
MMERKSSGLVKKGKYVRALMELLGTGPKNASQIIHSQSYDCGPNWDYIKANLDKLLESGEVLAKDWQGPNEAKEYTYFYLGHKADGYDPEATEAFFRTGEYIPTLDETEPVIRPKSYPTRSPVVTGPIKEDTEELAKETFPQTNKQKTYSVPVVTEIIHIDPKDKLPPNDELEAIIVWAWMNDYPWEAAAKNYCMIFKRKYHMVQKDKKWGERLEFTDED